MLNLSWSWIISMHLHNVIQINCAYKGICGGSWRDSGIWNDDYSWQATRCCKVFTTGSQWEGKVSIYAHGIIEAEICILFCYEYSIERICLFLTCFLRVYNDKFVHSCGNAFLCLLSDRNFYASYWYWPTDYKLVYSRKNTINSWHQENAFKLIIR